LPEELKAIRDKMERFISVEEDPEEGRRNG
jgi:hypothetical protein